MPKLTILLNLKVHIAQLQLCAIFISSSLLASAQECRHYTLNELIDNARKNYPYAEQLNLTKRRSLESVKSTNSEWLPQLSASGKTSYQSEISAIHIPKSIEQNLGMNLGNGKKLQYQGELSLSQLIYDGGRNSISKKLNKLNGDMQEQQVKSSILSLEETINDLFESILINKEQLKISQFQQTDLELRKKDIASAIQNGISLKTDLQEIDADIIQLKQQDTELAMQLCQKFVQLSSFTQQRIDTSAVFDLPQPIIILNKNYTNRPDYQLFGKQIQNVKWQLRQLNQKLIPQLSLFANGYYGRPGINSMDYSSHYSGVLGVSLKWNIAPLYNNVHQKRMINADKALIRNQQSQYELDMNRQIDNLRIDLIKNRKLIENDDLIVKIRSNVKSVAAVQLKNGSITLTDYLIKLNDESQALINRSIHKIKYVMNGTKMKTLLNDK